MDVGGTIGCGAVRNPGYRRTVRVSMVELEKGWMHWSDCTSGERQKRPVSCQGLGPV